jgi:hypothetical protein
VLIAAGVLPLSQIAPESGFAHQSVMAALPPEETSRPRRDLMLSVRQSTLDQSLV